MSGEISFGWVIQPVPRGFSDEVMADPTRATRALMAANERYIEAAKPHFDTVWAEDHFQWDDRPVLEAITSLTYLMGRHEGMRFGHIVLGQSYRNPALTAKMAALLHAFSGGNFILGIGAGWKEDEYRAYGYDFPPAGARIDQLDEAAQIIRALWNESPANFRGDYYRIENAHCEPRPNPPIPLLIAGGGEKKTLRVVARYADWWNHNFCTAEEFAHKQRVLAEHCREIGRDPGEIVNTYYGAIHIVDDPSEVAKRDFHIVGGTADMVARELSEFVKLGVKHFQLRFLDFPEMDGLEAFVEKVLPKLKAER
jgi:alkanesulfonate monooxygenase SsuD/methylene tetrahydromethanopterin reductase-like flavin-dependent oxidoreductase (luciferase family)